MCTKCGKEEILLDSLLSAYFAYIQCRIHASNYLVSCYVCYVLFMFC